jgi:ligand-binding SRPBCC domain-containing protein
MAGRLVKGAVFVAVTLFVDRRFDIVSRVTALKPLLLSWELAVVAALSYLVFTAVRLAMVVSPLPLSPRRCARARHCHHASVTTLVCVDCAACAHRTMCRR